jgi:hypothetical protein
LCQGVMTRPRIVDPGATLALSRRTTHRSRPKP